MIPTLIQMATLIGCGLLWRNLKPAGLEAEQTRLVLSTVVYYLFLPAMVLEVLWKAEIGAHSFQYTLLGSFCVAFGMAATWLLGRLLKLSRARMGAVILAASFPNVTFLGLPVLEQAYGAWARSVAIQLDFFAAGPILFTFGIMIAAYYGEDNSNTKQSPLAYLNTPPFWAAGIAVALNMNHVAMPEWLTGVMLRLADAVVPLMLLSIGLALNWQVIKWRQLPYVVPVIVVKMILMPLFALWVMTFLTLEGEYRSAAILEMAMPSMVLGIIFCDRYGLDTPLYAMTVTVTTLLSLVTLPIWYEFLRVVMT